MTDGGHPRDRFRDRLSEYLDGRLGPEEETLVEHHLAGCEDCRRTLGQLEAVVERAARLGARDPATDLWPGIAARIGSGAESSPGTESEAAGGRPLRRRLPAARGLARYAPQLAAAVAIAWLSGALVWMAGASDEVGDDASNPGFPSLQSPAGRTISTGANAEVTAAEYADLIAELEQVLFDAEQPLPPETVARIRRALLTIDRAIEDARAALRELPGDPYLQEHMNNTLQRKSEFLTQAVQLAASD